MQGWQAICADIQHNWMLYLSMPFVAAVIGFITKIVAIRMMFEPLEFVGIKPPYLGWQGIVPRKAAVMASICCDLMTTRLIKPEDVLGRLDPDRIVEEIERPLLEAVDDITRAVASHYSPGLWEAAPQSVKDLIVRRIKAESPGIVRQIMADIKRDMNAVFDLKDMVISALLRDKRLLNRIFLEAGSGEFRFIRKSGLYFGFAIGCVQAVTWALTHSAWVMPIFGGFTGWFTDWLALKMIFNPKQPTRYLGLFEWQGLFLKRRREVSAEYGRLVAREVVTPRNVFEAVLTGPMSDRLFGMIQKHVLRMVDEQAGIARPFVVFAIGSSKYQGMKKMIAEELMKRLPETMKHVEGYARDAMDLERTLVEKMQELTPEEFESLLRPAFQQDEWMLITVGAVLGFLVGELQVFLMLHH
ncbi:MAG: DUF445 domain-containing protein [Nevskia sp.]|nr:DUF445 domain-containing protein [Nevskia sp.]